MASERFGVVVAVSVAEKAKADREAREARAKRRAEALAVKGEQAKTDAALALARQGLRQSLSKLLYNALKKG